MNNAVHQLTKLILEAMAWVLNTAAALWVWSWTQIAALFGMAWGDLPGWKLAFVIAAGLFSRGFQWVVASMPDKLGVGAL
jgi:hypothetical protein